MTGLGSLWIRGPQQPAAPDKSATPGWLRELCGAAGLQLADLPLGDLRGADVSRLRLVAQQDGLQVWFAEASLGSSTREAARAIARATPDVVVLCQGSAEPACWLATSVRGQLSSGPIDPADSNETRRLRKALRTTDRQARVRTPANALEDVARLARRLARAIEPRSRVRILDEDEFIARSFPTGTHVGAESDALLAAINQFPLVMVPGKKRPRRAPQGAGKVEYERLRAELVRRHARLAFREAALVARTTKHLSWGDHVSAGFRGLFTAVDLFEASRGCQFSTYATVWIRSVIRREVQLTERMVQLPAHIQSSAEERRRLPVAFHRSWLSLSTDEADELTYEMAVRRYRDACSTATEADLPGTIVRLLAPLTERQRTILVRRYFRDETLEEVGADMGVSRERIRQIEVDALKKIRRTGGKALRELAHTRGLDLCTLIDPTDGGLA